MKRRYVQINSSRTRAPGDGWAVGWPGLVSGELIIGSAPPPAAAAMC